MGVRLAEAEKEQNSDLNHKLSGSEKPFVQSKAQKNPLRFLTGLVLFAVAASLLFQSIGTYIDGLSALQYKSVTARVNTVNTLFNAFDQTKVGSVEFTLDGKQQKSEVVVPPDRIVKANELVQVYYDKNNPNKATLTQEVDYDSTIVKGAFGLFALCFAILLLRKGPN